MELDSEWIASSYLFSSLLFTGKYPVLYQGWTLEWEMFFYLVFGFGLIFRQWVTVAVVVFVIIGATSLYSGNYIVIEFLFGMAIAFIFKNFTIRPQVGMILVFLGALALSLSIFNFIRELSAERTLIWGIPSAILVFGALKAKQYDSKVLNFLGDASYSIYLVQTFTIPAFYKACRILGLGIQTDFLALVCLAATAIFGCMIYVFLEKPLTQALRKKILARA